MILTLILALCFILAILLMLYAAVALVQDKSLFGSAPKDIVDAIQPREERFKGARFLGWSLIILSMLILVAVAVMLAIRWVGVMLINALLILPAASARNMVSNSRRHALFSVLIALVSGIAGLLAAYALDTSAGASIVLIASGFYAFSIFFRALRK